MLMPACGALQPSLPHKKRSTIAVYYYLHKADLEPSASPHTKTRRAPKVAPDAAAESAPGYAARPGLPLAKVAAPAGDRAAAAGSAGDGAGADCSPAEVDGSGAVLRERGSPLLAGAGDAPQFSAPAPAMLQREPLVCPRTPGCTKSAGHRGFCIGHKDFTRRKPPKELKERR